MKTCINGFCMIRAGQSCIALVAIVLMSGCLHSRATGQAQTYSYIDLNSSGLTTSMGLGINGGHQVGQGNGLVTGRNDHALLWSGSPGSVVDLNPGGFTSSSASGIYGAQQVGSGYGPLTGGSTHALVWHGSASSYVDLNPAGYIASSAIGTCGNQQVGIVYAGEGTLDLPVLGR